MKITKESVETSQAPSGFASMPQATLSKAICPQCHQPIVPQYYFCPNCGKDLHQKPLSTSFGAQLWLYTFSVIVMPLTCCLAYHYWKGWTYFRSENPKARRIGLIAIILLVASFVFMTWLTIAGVAWLQQYEQNQTNADMSSVGL